MKSSYCASVLPLLEYPIYTRDLDDLPALITRKFENRRSFFVWSNLGQYRSIESIVFVHIKMNKHIYTFTTNQFWLELLHTCSFYIYIYLYLFLHLIERRVTVAESNSMHDIKDQNKRSAKVSPVSCLKKKCFHIIISFYVHTTYIYTLSVHCTFVSIQQILR